VKQYGAELAVRTCRVLLSCGSPCLHFYTMNLSQTIEVVLKALGLHPEDRSRSLPANKSGDITASSTASDIGTSASGSMDVDGKEMPLAPWAGSTLHREGEQVRPIFWSNRVSSYLARTSEWDWDGFPNGRWGDSKSPAFGDVSEYYLAFKRPKVDRKKLWGTPQSAADVSKVFVGFLQGKVSSLPWCDTAPAAETSAIAPQLLWLNTHGILTINSQPPVNGCPSEDPVFGWGPAGGYCFQKAYLEMFCPPDLWSFVEKELLRRPNLTFHAVTADGRESWSVSLGGSSRCIHKEQAAQAVASSAAPLDGKQDDLDDTYPEDTEPNAVTWGVFPGREIVQPTVVDPVAFRAWKQEAFELWKSQWASAYKSVDKGGSAEDETAQSVIESIRSTYWLSPMPRALHTQAHPKQTPFHRLKAIYSQPCAQLSCATCRRTN